MYASNQQRMALYKIKKHRDLGFLLQKQEEKITDYIVKYKINLGEGQYIRDINRPLYAYYSYQKFDYTGKLVIRVLNKSLLLPYENKAINENKEIDPQQRFIPMCILSMKLNQQSWFNIEQRQKGDTSCAGYHGHHYLIKIQKFQVRNQNNFQSKKAIYEDNREKGKSMFQKKKYKDALKYYKHSMNILSGCSKKFFKPDELKILSDYLQKSESNYLKCVARLYGHGGRQNKQISQIAKKLSQKFMKKYPKSPNSYYQKAIYLKYKCRFGEAQDVIKQGLQSDFDKDPEEALKQKNSLKNILQEIKHSKQRNVRHLEREEIRRIKHSNRNDDAWSDDDV